MIGSDDRKDGLGTLETLTTTLIDSINGYRDAAENADGSRFQEIFRRNADERSRVVEELRSEIRRLGGNAPDDGSFLGATHQRFLDLKAAITGRDDQAIINEVERGEDYLKEKFEAALKLDMDPEARTVVERAYQSVRQGHDQISSLKHGLEA
ncbi:ferritin-like domain-containing protein [Sphingomonas astaxanthinifaciens]|uniref:Chemotaxis protein n=1 Tax=Sphingomonas astaxanthinifaciens DSM 22298 TaxID=1123267 RepID=A0ABQ5Z3S7_9SPHN|nr:PA2169 family four-helix-bundle protein [Sphingomonas astaxanthinifaciens]GLR47393.1 chemotaxis protein [Sphingomonas astaxanthinifaciens DSM 22298]